MGFIAKLFTLLLLAFLVLMDGPGFLVFGLIGGLLSAALAPAQARWEAQRREDQRRWEARRR